MRVYVSGPITGIPDYAAAFTAAADRLRTLGHEPVDPCSIGVHDGWTWHDYMDRAIDMQADCDAIYQLPGWQGSKGAVVEHYVARALGQRVYGTTGGVS